ncbi:MAG: LysE family translocator [Gammaproteobacteria bacterium]|nr:MAG: LysE family translocator [Gammaproteobacteria bacterium]
MTILSILGLAAAMFILAITPGPGVFATVSKALSSGFKHAVPVVIGIVVGDLIFLLLAIYGLSVIAETFGNLFTTIKYLGGGYLIWLGIKLWRSNPVKPEITESKSQAGKYSFLGGLSITLGNPKVILFYLGFLPTFVDLNMLSSIDVAIVASVVSLVLGSVMLFYAFTASRARRLFKSEGAQNKMNKTAGSVMIGTGVILLSKA